MTADSVVENLTASHVSSIRGLILSFQEERRIEVRMNALILSPASSGPFVLNVMTASGDSKLSPFSRTHENISGLIPQTT